jgi:proliferating cell nuclear antigen
MFKATIADTNLLRDSLSSISELIDEGTFRISQAGIGLIAADRAMVAVVNFSISSSAFENYTLDKDTSIGVNIGNLLSVLKRASGGDKISFDLQDGKMQVDISGSSRRKFVVPLIDLPQDEVPPIDQLEFSTKVQIRTDVLQSGIDDAEIVSDSILFHTTPMVFAMRAEGDVSKSELELAKGEAALIALETVDETKSRYPLDYLKKMVKAAKISDSVQLQFGQDYPMRLSFSAGDKASLQFVLAPRVSEN